MSTIDELWVCANVNGEITPLRKANNDLSSYTAVETELRNELITKLCDRLDQYTGHEELRSLGWLVAKHRDALLYRIDKYIADKDARRQAYREVRGDG